MIPFVEKLLGNSTANAATNIINAVTNTVDTFVDRPAEKEERDFKLKEAINKHLEEEARINSGILGQYFADIADARGMNTSLQTSANASWLSKNIAYMLDCLFVVSFICMLVMIFCKAVPQDNKELFYTGFGLLGGYVGTIINFHRGTSKSSEKKQEAMEQMIKNQ